MALDKQPGKITLVNLECVLMPNGELISNCQTVGWFRDLKDFLTEKTEEGKQ